MFQAALEMCSRKLFVFIWQRCVGTSVPTTGGRVGAEAFCWYLQIPGSTPVCRICLLT